MPLFREIESVFLVGAMRVETSILGFLGLKKAILPKT